MSVIRLEFVLIHWIKKELSQTVLTTKDKQWVL